MCNNGMLAKGHTHEPTELQKAIDQVGLNAIETAIRPHGHLLYCDMHGYYAVQGVQCDDDTSGAQPTEVCPLCPQLPDANGTPATLVELYIDLKDMGVKTSKDGIEQGNVIDAHTAGYL